MAVEDPVHRLVRSDGFGTPAPRSGPRPGVVLSRPPGTIELCAQRAPRPLTYLGALGCPHLIRVGSQPPAAAAIFHALCVEAPRYAAFTLTLFDDPGQHRACLGGSVVRSCGGFVQRDRRCESSHTRRPDW